MSDTLFDGGLQKLARWSFTADFGRNFKSACMLQMRCFGCDISRTLGNIPLSYGFARTRPIVESYSSSHYQLSVDHTTTLHLWAFGLALVEVSDCGEAAGIFIRRYERYPRMIIGNPLQRDVCNPRQLPKGSTPRRPESIAVATRLLALMSSELKNYENFVAETACAGHLASRNLSEKSGRHRLCSSNLSDAWANLAAIASQCSKAISRSFNASHTEIRRENKVSADVCSL